MAVVENVLAVVLAVGDGQELHPLTEHRTKSAVPFGGNYRVIDFVLTNSLRSGIRRVLVLSQYNSHTLHRHIRDGWSIYNPELGEYITPVAPQMRSGRTGYSGNADAVYQNINLIERVNAEHILLIPGDHIYRMDYAAMVDFHKRTNADMTIACIEGDHDPAERNSGMVSTGSNGRITGLGRTGNMISMNIILARKDYLVRLMNESVINGSLDGEFIADMLPSRVNVDTIMSYPFGSQVGRVTPDRYWCEMQSVDAYFEANMDLLRLESPLEMYQEDWPIRSYRGQIPPARTTPGMNGNEGIFVNSIVAGGTVIAGGGVSHSILFPDVLVEEGAIVENAILLPGVKVGEGAQLRNCIIDKHVKVPAGEQIGFDQAMDSERFTLSEKGIVVVPNTYEFPN